jgi:hypothetical protein
LGKPEAFRRNAGDEQSAVCLDYIERLLRYGKRFEDETRGLLKESRRRKIKARKRSQNMIAFWVKARQRIRCRAEEPEPQQQSVPQAVLTLSVINYQG